MCSLGSPKEPCGNFFLEAHVRLVVDALTALFHHRLALVLEVLLRDRERAHAVRFEPQAEREVVAGQRLKVVRPVVAGGAVG